MSLARRTILLTLSLLVLMSSISFSVGMHLCGGAIQDLALFHKAAACSMEQEQQPLPCHKQEDGEQGSANTDNQQDVNSDMSCCQDNLVVMDDVDSAVASKATVLLKSPDQQFIAVLQTAFLFLFPQEEAPKASHLSYASPPLVRDIPVFVQSFLI